jgi:hypothetical protein
MRSVIVNGALGMAWAAAACMAAACTSGDIAASSATAPASSAPALSSPGGTATRPPGPTGAFPASAWPEYGQNAGRTGVAAGLPAAGRLSQRWTAPLDGAVYGQPLAVGSAVIAATENDTVYALNESTGTVAWHTHLGTPVPLSSLPCGDIDPLGITGTPAYDRGNGLVYVVAETTGYHHVLFGLAVSDGAVKVQREIPVPGDPAAFQQRPGLAIEGGRVYAAFGGLYGDCGQYTGMVAGVPVSGRGALASWHAPTSREGAVWGIAGPVTGPAGDLWVSTGNGAAEQGQAWDGSDSVNRLTPSLARMNFFAPATWAQDNASDLDLGSTQPVLAAGNSTFIMGKRGVGYLLNTASMGGVGGQLAEQAICVAFGAGAVDGGTVYEPCYGGLAAISVSAAQRKIGVLWRGPGDGNGSPSIGGGAVWVASTSSGTLYELNPADGAVMSRIGIGGGLPHFPSVSLADGTAFVGTLQGVVAVNGA